MTPVEHDGGTTGGRGRADVEPVGRAGGDSRAVGSDGPDTDLDGRRVGVDAEDGLPDNPLETSRIVDDDTIRGPDWIHLLRARVSEGIPDAHDGPARASDIFQGLGDGETRAPKACRDRRGSAANVVGSFGR